MHRPISLVLKAEEKQHIVVASEIHFDTVRAPIVSRYITTRFVFPPFNGRSRWWWTVQDEWRALLYRADG